MISFRGWSVAVSLGLIASLVMAPTVVATLPYTPVVGAPLPGFGPGVITPDLVGGKEYSHDRDSTAVGGGAVGPPPGDPQQIVAWDGTIGGSGVVDVADYTGTRPLYTSEDQIDAIANRRDFGYAELKEDIGHLIFSVDDVYTGYGFGGPFPGIVPAAGPVALANGNVIGGAGEYSFEESGFFSGAPPEVQGLWAAQADVNGMPLPDDLDGVELWGPEPFGNPLRGDANKYSLDLDIANFGTAIPGDAVSVWNASGTPYVPHSAVVAAVTALLPGPIPTGIEVHELINVDALMVQDTEGDPDEFEPGPGGPAGPGPGDEIIFSIRQIPNPADPDGYYATGSELFVLNAGAPPMYLAHGGHLWDHAYSLAAFDVWFMDPQNFGVIDINAIEVVGEFSVPEPTGIALLLVGLASFGMRPRKR